VMDIQPFSYFWEILEDVKLLGRTHMKITA
jgi:hypothetical protein